jgi:hypothetical protein
MSRLLHLLLAIAVLWCGSHLGEPAMAADHPAEATCLVALADNACDPSGDESPLATHTSHHHCPSAPAHHVGVSIAQGISTSVLLRPHAVNALGSLSQAPPLQPPTS